MIGKHIELFLVSGEPGGITTAEVAGWTGRVVAGPRSELASLLRREEARRNGAYILLGPDPAAVEGLRAYIGRTENLVARMANHRSRKDWWERVILISSREDSFNEGHWGQLESLMVEQARTAGRCTLDDNQQTPQARRLSEAQQSDVLAFLKEVEIVLPVLGVNILRARTVRIPAEPPHAKESPVFRYRIAKRNVDAKAQQVDGEFFLLEGSRVVPAWTSTGTSDSTRRAYEGMAAHHRKLVEDGSIRIEDGVGIVTRDIVFSSPSMAGAIAGGRSCNGRISWITDNQQTFGDWEAAAHD